MLDGALSVLVSVVSNFLEPYFLALGRFRPLCCRTVKYYSPTTQVCIVKVGREHVRIARGAITLLTNIDGVGVLPVVWYCSGWLGEERFHLSPFALMGYLIVKEQ
jgi:RNase P/RNase MRP subunit POP5